MNQNNAMQCIIKMSPAIAAISEHCNKTISLYTYPKFSLTMAEINKIRYTLEYSMITLNTYVCELPVYRVKFCKFTEDVLKLLQLNNCQRLMFGWTSGYLQIHT
jgi:hypothetical protein